MFFFSRPLGRMVSVQELDIRNFAVSWFQTLFLYTARMPPDTLLWLWDVWVTEQSYKVSCCRRGSLRRCDVSRCLRGYGGMSCWYLVLLFLFVSVRPFGPLADDQESLETEII